MRGVDWPQVFEAEARVVVRVPGGRALEVGRGMVGIDPRETVAHERGSHPRPLGFGDYADRREIPVGCRRARARWRRTRPWSAASAGRAHGADPAGRGCCHSPSRRVSPEAARARLPRGSRRRRARDRWPAVRCRDGGGLPRRGRSGAGRRDHPAAAMAGRCRARRLGRARRRCREGGSGRKARYGQWPCLTLEPARRPGEGRRRFAPQPLWGLSDHGSDPPAAQGANDASPGEDAPGRPPAGRTRLRWKV